jgi:hypothetical protein
MATPLQERVYNETQDYIEKHNCNVGTALKKLGFSTGTYYGAKLAMEKGTPTRKKPRPKPGAKKMKQTMAASSVRIPAMDIGSTGGQTMLIVGDTKAIAAMIKELSHGQ